MSLKLSLTAISVLLFHFTSGQSVYSGIGARAAGLGYASACLKDEWALFNNIAGLSNVESLRTGFTYEALPALAGANRMAAVVALPALSGVAGAGIFRFGDDLYSEQIITAGFGNTFGLASLGAQINYIQYKAEGIGSKGVVSINFGGIAKLTPQFLIGAYIVNLNQPKLSSIEKEHLPARLMVGVAYTSPEKILITTEIEKDLDYAVTWKTGVEYKILSKLLLRTGFNLYPNSVFFGFGFRPRKFFLDYSFRYQSVLGFGHQASLSYNLQQK
jgi:hypothetical protein